MAGKPQQHTHLGLIEWIAFRRTLHLNELPVDRAGHVQIKLRPRILRMGSRTSTPESRICSRAS